MEKQDNSKYKILSITLFVVIVGIIIFVIIPKYAPQTPDRIIERIDFSKSDWIEQYVDKSVGIFGVDFFQDTAFTYSAAFNKMVVTYASQKSVEEARTFYLTLPGAKQSGRNDEISLNITAEKDGQTLNAYNYYSPIARVFKLDLSLETTQAEKIINQLQKAFPADEVAKIPEIKDLVSSKIYGGYVRYHYDNMDVFTYPNIPIFSRAYYYKGTEEDFLKIIQVLNAAYSKNKYDETQNTYYYQINGKIVSVSYLITDLKEKIVTVTIQ